jgi:hypothetical protein
MESPVASDFLEGQVWSYKTRGGEETSTILINKVESNAKLAQIFHISVIGVRVKNRRATSDVTTELPHLPVSKQTLDASCVEIVGRSSPHPQYIAGYTDWKRAFDQGRAGIWTASISEIVQAIEDAGNK